MSYTYNWPRPALTVDAVLFGVDLSPPGISPSYYNLQVLVVRRKNEPFAGMWALPGGFVEVRDDGDQGESLEDAAKRELKEETRIGVDYMEQLYTFGNPGRDPRGRVISVAYMAMTRSRDHRHPQGADDAAEAKWVSVSIGCDELDNLAFDHRTILDKAIERLRTKVRYAPIGFNLLPPKFTLTELQRLYEAILGRKLDKSNFRKRILAMGILKECEIEKDVSHRPARLYRFDKTAYNRAVLSGFNFEI